MSGMLFQQRDVGTSKGILAFPDHYVGIPQIIHGDDPVIQTINGRKWIRKGTIWPTNDANAKGIIFSDHEVIDGSDNNVTLIIHGFVVLPRLPIAPTEAAITTLRQIAFIGGGTQIAAPAEGGL